MKNKVTRNIKWLSSINKKNRHILDSLQEKMTNYYNSVTSYYDDIDFTADLWITDEELIHRDIINIIKHNLTIAEIGCGRANILKNKSIAQEKYTGVDFSHSLINYNQNNYPLANFRIINDPKIIPLDSEHFDVVLTHFVLEHTIFPNIFLDECFRILKKDGILIIITPDFLGAGRMSSQLSGFSIGTGREKLFKKKYIDSIFTGYDNKIKIPLSCAFRRLLAQFKPKFYINIQPIIFHNKNFEPDHDATYLTYDKEIKKYFKERIIFKRAEKNFKKILKSKKIIYLVGTKI